MKYSFSKDTLCCWRKSCIIKKKLYYKYGWAVKGAKVISVTTFLTLLSACHVWDSVVLEIEFPGEASKIIKFLKFQYQLHIYKDLFQYI